jgi:5-hydroxyisourate hydrolase
MTSLSTHVLDNERGAPAAGMRVRLYLADLLVDSAQTSDNGRIADLGGGSLSTGTYRLVFDVAEYLMTQHRPVPFLERVSLEFRLDAAQPHYHVPLLMTSYACTSYRGS